VQFLRHNALSIDFGEDDGYFGIAELPLFALANEPFHHYGIEVFRSEFDEPAMRTDGALEGGERLGEIVHPLRRVEPADGGAKARAGLPPLGGPVQTAKSEHPFHPGLRCCTTKERRDKGGPRTSLQQIRAS